MKPATFLPPVCALAIVISWLASQHRSLERLERRQTEMRAAIAARKEFTESHPGESRRQASSIRTARPPDWKGLARELAGAHLSSGDPRKAADLRSVLLAMSCEELVAELDKIQALGLDDGDAAALSQAVIEILAAKATQTVLERLADKVTGEANAWTIYLPLALGNLAATDPAGAAAWLDEAVQAGRLEARSLSGRGERLRFEAALIRAVLSTDPGMASQRLEGLSARHREMIFFESDLRHFPVETAPAAAELARRFLQPEAQSQVFSWLASGLLGDSGNLENVSQLMNAAKMDAAERRNLVMTSATSGYPFGGNRDAETQKAKIDEIRAWAEKESPGETAWVTGRQLARAAETLDFSEVLALADGYAGGGDGDRIYTELLSSQAAARNQEKARQQVGKISDPALREQVNHYLDRSR